MIPDPALEDLLNRPRCQVWGLPLIPLTFAETVAAIDGLVRRGVPGYIVTANLHTAMLVHADPSLRPVMGEAALCVADGMPLVWASRLRSVRVPERVAGSDLLPAMCELAARRGYGVFFLGGAPGIADEAAKKLAARFPGLRVAGVACPPFRELTADEEAALANEIRASTAAILVTAFSQPRGEIWLRARVARLGVPVAIQLGASIDFAAGKVQRAPRWIQRCGLEWAYRLSREPGRLVGRYWRNGTFFLRMLGRDLRTARGRRA